MQPELCVRITVARRTTRDFETEARITYTLKQMKLFLSSLAGKNRTILLQKRHSRSDSMNFKLLSAFSLGYIKRIRTLARQLEVKVGWPVHSWIVGLGFNELQ